MSNRSVSFGRCARPLDDSLDLMWLNKCKCPICITSPELLLEDWKARAVHNEFVIKQERQMAQDLLKIGEDAYEAYLEQIYSRSGLSYLWEYAKRRRRYVRISEALFGGS